MDELTSQLGRWLMDRFERTGAVINWGEADNGFSADTLYADIGGDGLPPLNLVVRIEVPGGDIFPDTDIRQQSQTMRCLAQQGVPVPNVMQIEKSGQVIGRRFFVMDRAAGRTFPQAPNYYVGGWVRDLEPWERSLLWKNALTLLGRINRLGIAQGFGFLDRPVYGQTGLDQYLGWLRAWYHSVFVTQSHGTIEAALDHLEGNRPLELPIGLVWGDSNPSNILFLENHSISVALDFEAAALGPAEIDLGWWLFLDRSRALGRPPLSGVPSQEEAVEIYAKALGRMPIALDYFEILAGVKMAMVVARTVQRLQSAGRLPGESRAGFDNPQAGTLAALIGAQSPEVGDDYQAFVDTVSRRGD